MAVWIRVLGLLLVFVGLFYFVASLFLVSGGSPRLEWEEVISYCLPLLVAGVGAIITALTEPNRRPPQ